MANGQRVLVVDGLAETEEVLRAVLEPRGLRVDRIRTGRLGRDAAPVANDSPRPQVVVLHEGDAPEGTGLDRWGKTPKVVIGSAKVPVSSNGHHYLQKPFQYRELIQAIERLLDESE